MNELIHIQELQIDNYSKVIKLNPGLEHFFVVKKGGVSFGEQTSLNTNLSEAIVYVKRRKLECMKLHAEHSATVFMICFDKNILPNYFFYTFYNETNQITLQLGNNPCYNRLLDLCKMIEFENEQEVNNLSILKTLLNTFFTIFKNEYNKQSLDTTTSERNFHIEKLLYLIEKHFKENKSISFYASAMVLSERQVSKLFKLYFDTTLLSLITSRKIVEAQLELEKKQKTISEIGYDLGFEDKSYFTKVFKKVTGYSPKDYQQKFTS